MATVTYLKNLMPSALILKLGDRYVNINPGTSIPLSTILVSDPMSASYNKDKIEALVARQILAQVTVTAPNIGDD